MGVVQKAMIVEAESEQTQKDKVNKKRKFGVRNDGEDREAGQKKVEHNPGFQVDHDKNFRKVMGTQGSRTQDSNQSKQLTFPLSECKTCGKKHPGPCNKDNVVCYQCNHKGHFANECRS